MLGSGCSATPERNSMAQRQATQWTLKKNVAHISDIKLIKSHTTLVKRLKYEFGRSPVSYFITLLRHGSPLPTGGAKLKHRAGRMREGATRHCFSIQFGCLGHLGFTFGGALRPRSEIVSCGGGRGECVNTTDVVVLPSATANPETPRANC